MIRTLFITFFFAFTVVISVAQTRQEVDSLQHQLASAKDDTSRIDAEIGLCRLYRLGNTDSSLIYGQRALKSAQKINYYAGEIAALSFMCIATEQQGNLPKSLELGFKALQLAEEHHLESSAGAALYGLTEAYILLKDYSKALGYVRTHISIVEPTNEEGFAYAYFHMGMVFEGMNQLDSATIYEEKAIETFHKYNHEEPLVYQTLGDIAMKSGSPGGALSYYQKSLRIAIKNNQRRASAYAYNKIAFFYKNENRPDSAIYYAGKGLEESKRISQKKTILEAASLLSELYESKDTKQSLMYLKIADAYKDSLFGAGNMQAVQALVAHEGERKKEIEAAKVTYQNQLKQYVLLAGLLMLLVIAFFLYRNNRKEKKAKNILKDKNEVIEQTLSHLKTTQAQLIQSEKMASLGELTAGIAHEIQNPLNFVNNFSEVNKELIEELEVERVKAKAERNEEIEEEIITNIKENEEKISYHGKRADSIVKGMLEHSRSSAGVKEPTDINKLADEYLRLSYHGMRAKDKNFNADFKTEFDNSIGKINIVPQDIGRVLLNLINNAFYAVGEKVKLRAASLPAGQTGYKPQLIVHTRKLSANVEIRIEDNGNGIAKNIVDKIFQPFFTTKPTGQGTGLGLSLAYDIIKAHGGGIKVKTNEGEGSEFTIELPGR